MKYELNKLLAIGVVGIGATFLASQGDVDSSAVIGLYGFILGYVFKNGKDLVQPVNKRKR